MGWLVPERREQHLWDNRMERRVYDAFVDIWDREDLWVTIDRANLNPPKKAKGNPNGFIHWDSIPPSARYPSACRAC